MVPESEVSTPAPRRPGAAVKCSLSLAATLLTVLAVEVGYRLSAYGLAGLSPVRMASVRDFGDTGFTAASPEAAIEYELKPDIDAWFKLYPFETSSSGLRDLEYPREKPQGTFRIAVVGDSYTMGSGVPLEAAYHSVLEATLNRESAKTRYEVLNFGVAGYGLLHYLGVIEHRALGWDPDLLLIGLVSNDRPPPAIAYFQEVLPGHPDLPRQVRRNPREEAPAPPFLRLTVLDRLGEASRREEDPELSSKERLMLRKQLAITAAGGDVRALNMRQYHLAVFQRIRDLTAAAGVPVVCVYLDTMPPPSSAATDFEWASSSVGFGFLDTCPQFEGMPPGRFAVLPGDGHPNAEAHAMYAAAILAALREGGRLPD